MTSKIDSDRVILPLPTDLLEAIGAYTVHFSVLDSMITKCLSLLLGLSDEEAILLGQKIQSTENRIMLFEFVGRTHVIDEQKEIFSVSMKKLRFENSERNKIIHWIWIAEQEQENPEMYKAKLRGKFGTNEKSYTVAELHKRWQEISLLTTQMRKFTNGVLAAALQQKPPEQS